MILPKHPHPCPRQLPDEALLAQRRRLMSKQLWGYAGAREDRQALREATHELLKIEIGKVS